MQLDLALRLTNACVRAARDQNIKIVAVATDVSGEIVAMARMDGVGHVNTGVARRKALAAATFGLPTHDVVESVSRDAFAKPVLMSDPTINVLPGGMPVFDDNKALVGALGVAGAYYLQDRAIVEYAIGEGAK